MNDYIIFKALFSIISSKYTNHIKLEQQER